MAKAPKLRRDLEHCTACTIHCYATAFGTSRDSQHCITSSTFSDSATTLHDKFYSV